MGERLPRRGVRCPPIFGQKYKLRVSIALLIVFREFSRSSESMAPHAAWVVEGNPTGRSGVDAWCIRRWQQNLLRWRRHFRKGESTRYQAMLDSARTAAVSTRKVFWTDPYRRELTTRIAYVEGEEVQLEETIFYAESGGQESDAGTLGTWPVLQATKRGEVIVYRLDAQHDLKVGDSVDVRIDWPRRYRLMRLHFAAEVILERVYRKLNMPDKVGAHIAEQRARIDFVLEQNIATYFPEILAQAHALIEANSPIVSAFSDVAAERRYWEVAGFARVPCGGTHLRRTGEVGQLKLRRKNIGKGKERIEITLVDGHADAHEACVVRAMRLTAGAPTGP